MTTTAYNDLELMQLQCEALFLQDAGGKLLGINEPDPTSSAPQFFLARTAGGNLWRTRYDLPPELLGKALGGRFRGQTQRWFALRFLGTEAEIRLDLDPHPEFDAWRWARLDELPALAVGFKRAIYETLARDFARFAGP